MRSYAVQPRVLADDLQIISTGSRHLEHFELALNRSHKHLKDMGARIAPDKSMTFPVDPVLNEFTTERNPLYIAPCAQTPK